MDGVILNAMFESWWLEQTAKGDPSRNSNLTREAFAAGWQAARAITHVLPNQAGGLKEDFETFTKRTEGDNS